MNTTNRKFTRKSQSRHRGIAIIYVCVFLTLFAGLVSLAVDFGRVQVAKTELRLACDAAARYAASGLQNVLWGESAAAYNGIVSAAENKVDGHTLVLQAGDVETGIWDTTAKTFTPNSTPSSCNAVRVTAQLTAARGTAVPMSFLSLLGRSSFDLKVQSIAMYSGEASQNVYVPATSNPYLAGEPAGTVASNPNPHNNPDYANGTSGHPNSSPVQISGVPITQGSSMTFDGINGGATNDFTDPHRYSADGNESWILNNYLGGEHGISDMTAPINSLIGVFIDSNVPDNHSQPSALDFSTDASRNYTTLSPQLNQVFFIGDGRTDSGEVQHIVVPNNAKRLYIGMMDGYEWNNNIGGYNLTVHSPGTVTIVQ